MLLKLTSLLLKFVLSLLKLAYLLPKPIVLFVKVTTGDYEALLEKVVENLSEAVKHAANDLEKNMIKEYIQVCKIIAHKALY